MLITYYYARDGNVDGLRRLRVEDGLTAQDARFDANLVLRTAARNGHAAVLQELREGWGLTAQNARVHDNWALREAAANGHATVLQELREGWGLTVADARVYHNLALRDAATNGHVAVLQELREWGLTVEDARVYGNHALRSAALNGHAAVLQELREGWGLTVEDARVQGNLALRAAAMNGYVDMLRELREGWGLTVEDAESVVGILDDGPGRDYLRDWIGIAEGDPVDRVRHRKRVRHDWSADTGNFKDDYREFCKLVTPVSLGNLREILNHLEVVYDQKAPRQKLCRILYREHEKWLKDGTSTYSSDEIDSLCTNSDDPIDMEPLAGRRKNSVIRIPTGHKVGDRELHNCYSKSKLRDYLKTQGCRMDGDFVRGRCVGAFRENLIEHPGLLREVLGYQSDRKDKYFA